MILDNDSVVDEDLADDIDVDEEAGEWLDGLRQAGLPVAASRAPDRHDGVRAELRERVVERASHAKSVGSRLAYSKDFRDFGSWCAAHDLEALPAEPLTVAAYLDSLATDRLAISTLRRRKAAIRWMHHGAGLPDPTVDELVAETVADAARDLSEAKDQAVPLMLGELRRMITAMPIITGREPNDPLVRRDQSLLAIGWASALRSSELAALDAADLQFIAPTERHAGGMIVRVGQSKTDQTAVGDDVAVPYSLHWSTCPVRLAQLQLRHTPSGPLFRALGNRSHGHRLHANNVALIVRRYVRLILQVDPTMYSGHSLRAGFATEASDHGVDAALTQRQLRQKDPRSLRHYTRPTDLLTRPALAGDWW